MAKFLVTFQWGDMPRDPDTVSEARRRWVWWAAQAGPALVDAGTPIRSTATLTRRGVSDGEAATLFMGWSVIDAQDCDAAAKMLRDHPLVELGAMLQINEPI